MSASHLSVVSQSPLPAASIDPVAQRIRDLRIEARTLAQGQVERLQQSLVEIARLAAEIAGGGDAYGVGAREFARQTAEDAGHHASMLAAIVDRERN